MLELPNVPIDKVALYFRLRCPIDENLYIILDCSVQLHNVCMYFLNELIAVKLRIAVKHTGFSEWLIFNTPKHVIIKTVDNVYTLLFHPS